MTISTPHFDQWLTEAARQLSPYGRKAELAAHLSQAYGRSQRSWESYLSAILRRDRLPNAEIYIAIDLWLKSQA